MQATQSVKWNENTNEKMIWNTQDLNLSWYVPKANVDHTISGQGTAISTLDHSATMPWAGGAMNMFANQGIIAEVGKYKDLQYYYKVNCNITGLNLNCIYFVKLTRALHANIAMDRKECISYYTRI